MGPQRHVPFSIFLLRRQPAGVYPHLDQLQRSSFAHVPLRSAKRSAIATRKAHQISGAPMMHLIIRCPQLTRIIRTIPVFPLFARVLASQSQQSSSSTIYNPYNHEIRRAFARPHGGHRGCHGAASSRSVTPSIPHFLPSDRTTSSFLGSHARSLACHDRP